MHIISHSNRCLDTDNYVTLTTAGGEAPVHTNTLKVKLRLPKLQSLLATDVAEFLRQYDGICATQAATNPNAVKPANLSINMCVSRAVLKVLRRGRPGTGELTDDMIRQELEVRAKRIATAPTSFLKWSRFMRAQKEADRVGLVYMGLGENQALAAYDDVCIKAVELCERKGREMPGTVTRADRIEFSKWLGSLLYPRIRAKYVHSLKTTYRYVGGDLKTLMEEPDGEDPRNCKVLELWLQQVVEMFYTLDEHKVPVGSKIHPLKPPRGVARLLGSFQKRKADDRKRARKALRNRGRSKRRKTNHGIDEMGAEQDLDVCLKQLLAQTKSLEAQINAYEREPTRPEDGKMASRESMREKRRCHKCHEVGHLRKDCPDRKDTKASGKTLRRL